MPKAAMQHYRRRVPCTKLLSTTTSNTDQLSDIKLPRCPPALTESARRSCLKPSRRALTVGARRPRTPCRRLRMDLLNVSRLQKGAYRRKQNSEKTSLAELTIGVPVRHQRLSACSAMAARAACVRVLRIMCASSRITLRQCCFSSIIICFRVFGCWCCRSCASHLESPNGNAELKARTVCFWVVSR